jgi:hypothetical protein
MDEVHILLFVRMMIVLRWPDQVHFRLEAHRLYTWVPFTEAEHLNSYALFRAPVTLEYPFEPPANFRSLGCVEH